MRLIKFYHADLLNGEGLREVIFLSGCTHKCEKCFSPETWDPGTKLSHPWSNDDWEELIQNLDKPYIDGVTISGGDPLSVWNYQDVSGLCIKLKEMFPNKTIWIYTGYTWEYILDHPELKTILNYVDVLCDGPYIDSLKSPQKPWVGSSNQKVINVKESLIKNEIILLTY